MASIVPTQWPGRLAPRRSWPDRLSLGSRCRSAHTPDCFSSGFRSFDSASVRGGAGAHGELWVAGPQEEAGLSKERETGQGEGKGASGTGDVREACPRSSRTRRNTARPAGRGGPGSAPEAPRLPRARLAGRGCLPAEVDGTLSPALPFSLGCLGSRAPISAGSQRPEGQRASRMGRSQPLYDL